MISYRGEQLINQFMEQHMCNKPLKPQFELVRQPDTSDTIVKIEVRPEPETNHGLKLKGCELK